MKRFFKQIVLIALGTVLGVIIILGLAMVLVIAKQHSNPTKLTHKSILRIALHGQLVEKKSEGVLQVFDKVGTHEVDVLTIKKAIQAAQKDDRIAGIYLEIGKLLAGWAILAELRESLQAFKGTGKFIIAYGESYTSKNYYLASLADEIVLHPAGNFIFTGLNLTVLFYKELLDKLEIVPHIFRVGRYKSAIEPFTSCAMSDASKEQHSILLHTIYDHFIQTISTARNLPSHVLLKMANTLAVTQPQAAYKAHLVTQLGYFSEVEALLRSKLQLELGDKIAYVDYDAYQRITTKQLHTKQTKEKIAVVVVTGTIVDEELGDRYIVASTFVKMLRKLKEDPNVKAIVLSINSPGGSALASDSMWKELMLARACKPIVASMSDIAASGGYYIASGCNYILAHPTTITGSIGIFALYFDVHRLLKNKLGIYGDVVKTSPSADMFSISRPLSEHEKHIIQQHVDNGYAIFLDRVAIGRQMAQTDIAVLANGRVWPGSLAKQHGLVDELGSLERAIEKAALLAGLQPPYQVEYFPKANPNWLQQLLIDWLGMASTHLQPTQILQPYQAATVKNIEALAHQQGIQAWLPYTIEIQ